MQNQVCESLTMKALAAQSSVILTAPDGRPSRIHPDSIPVNRKTRTQRQSLELLWPTQQNVTADKKSKIFHKSKSQRQ